MNTKMIEAALGTETNISKRMIKEDVLFYTLKDSALIQNEKLHALSEVTSVSLAGNRIKVFLKPEKEEKDINTHMANNNKDYTQLAQFIIEHVGGKENINSLRHCITRVRFRLADESKADDQALENNDGVISVVKGGGEYMVVIGTHVGDVYDEINNQLGNLDASATQADAQEKKGNIFMRCLNSIMGAVTPALNFICAAGVIKGILAVCTMCGMPAESGIYMLLNAMGDSVFYFLPLFLGYNMAKNKGIPGQMGLFIGAALLYPAINGTDVTIFGYTVNAVYSSSFLPVILITALAVPIYKWLNTKIPAVIAGFSVPMLTLLAVFPLGFMLVGPFANWVGQLMNVAITSVMNFSPIIGGALFAGLYQVMVLFGVHSAITSFSFMNVLSGHPDAIMALGCYCSFAQIGVVLAMYLKTKDQKLKSVALPAFISGVFGVTEPAIYGVTLPNLKMFIVSCIGAAIGGAYIMMTHTLMYSFTGLGIVTILGMVSPEHPDFFTAIMCAVIPFVVSFIMGWIVYTNKETAKSSAKAGKKVIEQPLKGKVVPLSEVSDATFSQGLLGHGYAIEPADGKVIAPFDGEVLMVFDTLHALGLKSNDGVEVLIHVGIDTVNLEGKPFTAHVKTGDKIKKGQLLLEADLDLIKANGLQTITPVIVTNETEVGEVSIDEENLVIA